MYVMRLVKEIAFFGVRRFLHMHRFLAVEKRAIGNLLTAFVLSTFQIRYECILTLA